jgi:hypothetical protein
MRIISLPILAAVAALSSPAKAGPNVQLCLAMENNYNECLRQQEARQRHREHEREREEWARAEGAPDGWEGHRHHHHDDDGGDCSAMLVELKGNGCF